MTKNKKYFYPLPKEFVEKYAHDIFDPVRRGECVTAVWVGSAGRRTVTKFIIENIDLFKEALPKPSSYLLVYVEPLDLTEENLRGYLRLIGSSFLEACRKRKDCMKLISDQQAKVFEEERVSYAGLLSALKACIHKVVGSGIEVVLFLGEFDELEFVNTVFCNNLSSIWNHFDGGLHYVFLIKEVKMVFEMERIGEELARLFLTNVIYVPISKENTDYLIGRFEERISCKLTDEEREILKEMGGGHPYFLKVGCGILAKRKKEKLSKEELIQLLKRSYEVRPVARRIIEVQTPEAQAMLEKIATGKVKNLLGDEMESLEWLGLVEKGEDGYYRPFCQLFLEAVLKKTLPSPSSVGAPKKLILEPETGALLFGRKSIDEEFTRQEHEVLTFLLKDPNRLKTRDEIGDILWGEDSYEKYSNWAIDQLMSKLRKKLEEMGVGKNTIITVRGRGYKFSA